MDRETKLPAKKFRSGAVSVAVWRQSGPNGNFYNATAQRAFKRDEASEWEYTTSFNRDDLPTVNMLLQMAFAWIVRTEEKEAELKREGNDPGDNEP